MARFELILQIAGEEGEPGPPGKQGKPGTDGDNGSRGSQGPDGSRLHFTKCLKVSVSNPKIVSAQENNGLDDQFSMLFTYYKFEDNFCL